MLIKSSKSRLLILLLGLQLLICFESNSQNVKEAGISELFAAANKYLTIGDWRASIPYLQEAVDRTSDLTDPQGRETCQTCRFQLARAHYQDQSIPTAMKIIEDYLLNEPKNKESSALRLKAKGFFELQEWDQVEIAAIKLLSLDRISDEDEYDANLLLGQALYRQEKWKECIDPLQFAANESDDQRTIDTCNIMVVGAMVKAEDWSQLFNLIPSLYLTDAKYDITLNLTLMNAGKARYEEGDLLNALLLYRMVLPREQLLSHTDSKIKSLILKLEADKKIGIRESEILRRQNEINALSSSTETLIDLPPYEDEVLFRIASIYSERNRYWEGFVLFDELYQQDSLSEIGEAALYQSVLLLYDLGQINRAEQSIIGYLRENPNGQYVRPLLNLMMRDNYIKRNYQEVVNMKPYLDLLSIPIEPEEKALQSELHYLLAFGSFQSGDYQGSGEQFTTILDSFPNSIHFSSSRYYRGMTYMFQADYNSALNDFTTYREQNNSAEHTAASLFRQAVCQYGLEDIDQAQSLFSDFISLYPDNSLISEAYSYRADILASREASAEIPNPLDLAIIDYKNGIDTAQTTLQSSYAAFKAAEVYKLEDKWDDIVDLMNYYLDRWEESANIAEATFWIGKSKINLNQIDEALNSYLDTINRFGNDLDQPGVDKIIVELSKAASDYLNEDDYDILSSRIGIMSSQVDDKLEVLKIRLKTTQAMLDSSQEEYGKDLLDQNVDIKLMSPVTLAILCDISPKYAFDRIDEITSYFFNNYEESEQLWHAYRAQANKLQKTGSEEDVLKVIESAQGIFGADPYMGWAQLMKANAYFGLGNYIQAEKEYEFISNIREWKGVLHAEAWYNRGVCRSKLGEPEVAHTFFQRTYLLFKGYDKGHWAAKSYLAAAKILQDMGRNEDAINTLEEMINDTYTANHPLTQEARIQLELL